MTTKRIVTVGVNPLHETPTLGVFSSLFSESLLTEDALAVIGRIIATVYAYGPTTTT